MAKSALRHLVVHLQRSASRLMPTEQGRALLAKPFQREYAYLAVFAILATAVSLWASRWVFQRALLSYRSASS